MNNLKNLKGIKLVFGNNEQIEFVKKLEEKIENEEKIGKTVIWEEKTEYQAECPYCGNESYFSEDEDDAFDDITETLDNGDVVCNKCNKKLNFGI